MRREDFLVSTPDELEAIFKAHSKERELAQQTEWERMRLHAAMTMQPHCKNRLNPQTLLPFAWEHKSRPERSNPTPVADKETARAEFEAFLARRQSGETR